MTKAKNVTLWDKPIVIEQEYFLGDVVKIQMGTSNRTYKGVILAVTYHIEGHGTQNLLGENMKINAWKNYTVMDEAGHVLRNNEVYIVGLFDDQKGQLDS